MNLIQLSPLNMLSDWFVAAIYLCALVHVGLLFYRGHHKLLLSSRIILIFIALISSIFIFQTVIQYLRGGRSAYPELWDVLNVLTAMLCHMVIARKSILSEVEYKVFP